ncbi:hypothetical protein BKA70DRAFT_1420733 [Coprinopsis sp. MPI-PUGE-AT-0042]|nr:hypothetical protein BKA70DRAFT_1420733 [Coprinopsis sp. MPI-PUGE-AT-0042]
MDDSDDYFGDDDLVLDEQTLAALDESERRHGPTQGQATQAPHPPPQAPRSYVQPATKRARTETGWSPGLGSRQDSLTDLDLPEISVQGNSYTISSSSGLSTYGIRQQQPAPTRQSVPQVRQTAPIPRQSAYHPEQRPFQGTRQENPPRPSAQPQAYAQERQTVPGRSPAHQQQQQPSPNYLQNRQFDNRQRPVSSQGRNSYAQGNAPSVPVGQAGQQNAAPVRQFQPQAPASRGYVTPVAATGRLGAAVGPATGPVRTATPAPAPQAQGSADIERRLKELQDRCEELRRTNEKLQAERDSAVEVRMRKEGEVVILRQNRDKDRGRYAEDLAKLRAAKEEASAQILRTQQTHKEEVERLKTQFTFKQQEMEANFRRIPTIPVPPSVRAKKIGLPPTPLTRGGPSQSSWNMDVPQTPSKRSQPFSYVMPKVLSPKKPATKSPEKTRKAVLPGFQNAFATSTPVLGIQKRVSKGKEKAPEFHEPIPPPLFSQPPPTIPPGSQSYSMAPPDSFPPASPTRAGLSVPQKSTNVALPPFTDHDGDFAMEDIRQAAPAAAPPSTPVPIREGNATPDMVVEEELDEMKPTNWKAELSRIVLTHIRPNSGHLTLELVLGANIEDDDPDIPARYMRACSAMVNALSYSSKMEDYTNTISAISAACITLLETLSFGDLILPIASLLNLLGLLAFFIPQFRTQLFLQQNPVYRGLSSITAETLRIIITILGGPNTSPTHAMLGMEVLDFLEAMAFQADETEMVKFETVIRSREAMIVLLDPQRPVEFLEKFLRLLVIYASHPVLYSALIGARDPHGKILGSMEPNELLRRLQPFLTYHLYAGPEFSEIRHLVLTFLGQLSQSHQDAHLVVAASCVLQLSWYIHTITTPLWEEDPKLLTSLERSSSLIKHTCQSVHLVYHLIAPYDPERLRKWLQAPSDTFRNAMEMFIVTFSRLGFAEPPDWLDQPSQQMLEQSQGIAQKVLETVVDGPELDSVVEVFAQNDSEEESSMIDEDEMEAELS